MSLSLSFCFDALSTESSSRLESLYDCPSLSSSENSFFTRTGVFGFGGFCASAALETPAEALEFIVHGDEKSSKVVGRAIEDIKSPPGATLAALVRDGEVIIAHHDTVIQSGDHVIVFVVDKEKTKAVEKLFSVGFSFF